MVAVGEEGGRVPEVMRHQTGYWHEEASRRLKIAARVASMALWMVYVSFMLWAISSVYGVVRGN
jgi:hypothetical protein